MRPRPRFGFWAYRYGFSVVALGYGVSLGVCRASKAPVVFFRNRAYRGLR